MTYLVGLSGPKGVGKTTTKNILIDTIQQKYNIGSVSFAEPVYNIVSEITGESVQWIQENKTYTWQAGFLAGWTPRRLLQYVGTDLFRNNLSQSIWVDIAINKAKKSLLDIAIFDDCRFENEVAQLDLTIELQRAGVGYTGEHLSEMGGLPVSIQWSIDNPESITALAQYIIKRYEATK